MNITIPLSTFLDAMWGIREHANIDTGLANLIKSCDTEETLCHVQWPGDLDAPHDIAIPRIWRKQAWLSSYERYTKVHKRSNLEREVRSVERELQEAIIKQIMAVMGFDKDQALPIAQSIIVKRNSVLAKTFGIDLAALTAATEKLNNA